MSLKEGPRAMSILTVHCLHRPACPQSQCLSRFGPLGPKLENTDGLRVQLEGEPRSGGGDPAAPEVGKMCFQGYLLDLIGGGADGVTWLLSVREDPVLSHTLPQHCAVSPAGRPGSSISGHVLVRSGGVPGSHLCGIHVAPV